MFTQTRLSITLYVHWLPCQNLKQDKYIQGDQKVSVPLTITVQKTGKNTVLLNSLITYHNNVSAYAYGTLEWLVCRQNIFIKPFGLQDLRIFLRPICFFLWGAMKNSVYSNNPHTVDDLKMAIAEYIRNLREHSSVCP